MLWHWPSREREGKGSGTRCCCSAGSGLGSEVFSRIRALVRGTCLSLCAELGGSPALAGRRGTWWFPGFPMGR